MKPSRSIHSREEVREAAGDWLRWTARDMARQEMEKLRPEIREQVISIIDSLKGTKETLTEKSITDSLAYVRCPTCWSRVYRGNSILIPEPATAKDDETEPKAKEEAPLEKSADAPAPTPSFWAALNENMKK